MSAQPIYSFRLKDCILGFQTLFIAIGATVMVPLLTGMPASTSLLTAGIGTLIFQVITKGQIPVFLGSSFAYVSATIFSMQTWGLSSTLCGLAASSLAYYVMSFLVYLKGASLIQRIFPPLITGPTIMNIGLVLAPVAINMSLGKSSDGQIVVPENIALIIAFTSLFATVITRLFGKGRLALIPILIGIVAGYVVSLYFNCVDFNALIKAPWLSLPALNFPSFHLEAILLMLPIAAVTCLEHVGGVTAIGSVTQINYFKNPGLHRSLLGDGVASMVAASIGGPPSITYAEVTAGVAITRTFNPGIMTWAAICAILLSFIGKVGAILQTIPLPVMGGVLILLFGAIIVTGLHLLVKAQYDLMNPRNMTIVGVILILPVGGLSIGAGNFAISGIGLGGLVGVVLNLLLPERLGDLKSTEVPNAKDGEYYAT